MHVVPHHTRPCNVLLDIYLDAKLIYNWDYHSIYMQILSYCMLFMYTKFYKNATNM